MKYLDLVLCEHSENGKRFLFRAPEFSMLKQGDLVVTDTRMGDSPAKVLDVLTVTEDEKTMSFIVKALGATTPLMKIKSRVIFDVFEYKEEKND